MSGRWSGWRGAGVGAAAVAVALSGAEGVAGQGAEGAVGWDDPRWRFEAAEHRVEDYRGRRALVLAGGVAWLDGAGFRDGVVEFDLAAPATLGFHGLAFRAVSDLDYEHVYVRPFLSGAPDATQYTPVFHGVSGWQIYASPRYAAALDVPPDRWMRVRAAVRDGRAELSVDGETAVFPALVRHPVSGALGLTASGAPARFADLVVRPGPVEPAGGPGAPAPDTPAGTVRCWRVSTPFAEGRVEGAADLAPGAFDDLGWDPLGVEPGGVANLARLRPLGPGANTVFAAVAVRASRPGPVLADLGFSDRVKVYLDGRPLYAGSDVWRSRDYRFLGTVGLHDRVVLPLGPGEHEVRLAVSEDFGGWAALLRLPEGVRVVAPDPSACEGALPGG